jgi:hypothetical protein
MIQKLIKNRRRINTEWLKKYTTDFSMPLYNTLYEILVEKTIKQLVDQQHWNPDATHHIENPLIIKVITSLIRNNPNQLKNKQLTIIKNIHPCVSK